MNNAEVGKRIASLRKGRGLTGEALARMIHVTPQAVSKWENGRCLPETSVLPLLSNALGRSIDDILKEPESGMIYINSFEEILHVDKDRVKAALTAYDPEKIVKASMGASPEANRYLREIFPEIDFTCERNKIGGVRIEEVERIHAEIIDQLNVQ